MRKAFLAPALLSVFASVAAHATPKRVVALGDSLTEGYGVARENAYPAVLQKLLQEGGHAEVQVINAGISGSTTASGIARLRWQLNRRPDIVILELGANDGLRGLPISEIKKNLSDVIELAQSNHIRVLLAAMKLPPSLGPAYTQQFAELFPALAKKYDVPMIPFLLQDVAAHRELNLEDGVHPNEKGYQMIARTVLRALTPLL